MLTRHQRDDDCGKTRAWVFQLLTTFADCFVAHSEEISARPSETFIPIYPKFIPSSCQLTLVITEFVNATRLQF